MNIPEFKSVAGQFFPETSLGYGDKQLTVTNTTLEDFTDYAKTLCGLGYTLHAETTVSAGSFNPYPDNLFYTFNGKEENLFLSFNPSYHLTRIVATDKTQLPNTCTVKEKAVCPVKFTQYPVKIGMCYIIQLANGNYIMVDGGSFDNDDACGIFSFLKNNSVDGNIVIENWIFTHPDVDHIELATHFLLTYKNELTVLSFTYQFCEPELITNKNLIKNVKADIKALENSIALYKNAKIYTPHRGQTFYYNGLSLVFLWTCEDLFPAIFNNFNDVSLAFKINFDGGKSALILGDCMHEACRQIATTYGEYLKCDWLQVTHHGLIGGDKLLYKLADPSVCFWPTPENRFNGTLKNQKYQWCLGDGGCDYNAYLRDNTVRERTHYPNKEIITLIAD